MIIWGQGGVDNIQNISNIFLSQDVSVRLSHAHLASLPFWSSLGTCSPPICLVHCVRSSTLFLQCLSVRAPLDRKPFLWLSRLCRTWAAQYLRCLSVGILPRALEEASLQVEDGNPKKELMNFCGKLMLESGAMCLCSSASPPAM